MNETKKRGNANLPALILLAVLLMFWQAAAMGIDAAYILPSPTQILVRLWELRGPLFTAHLPATMSVVAIGLSISIVLGLGLAVLMDISEIAEKALYPLIIASQTIPTTALAPLFVLWFGYGIWSKVLVTVLITVGITAMTLSTAVVKMFATPSDASIGYTSFIYSLYQHPAH